ncbi:MAG: ATP-binding protein [Chitinophagales bacterium]
MANSEFVVRVLIIDDDEDDFFIIREYIRKIHGWQFFIDWSYNYHQSLDLICSGKYDIYFVDYLLGPKTGLDLIKDAMKNNCEEPIILFTGKGNHQVDIEAMKAGAFDYQVKLELNEEKLERTIRYALDKTKALKALKANERKFKSFFEKSKDAVFLANESFNFQDVNYAMIELFEYSTVELYSMTLFDLIPSLQVEALIRDQLKNAREVDDMELEIKTKNGDKKYCILSLTQERNEQGKIYLQGIIHDISNLKKVEKANLMAEKFSAASRIARTLAHEIRNPLNNIILSVEQLKMEIKAEESQTFFDIISRNSIIINDLISELLSSSRASEIVLKDASLQSIIDQAVEQASDRMKLKKIELKVNYPKQLAMIKADAEKLKLAFLNLFINAVEAMEEGWGQLQISISDNNPYYLVTIKDNGVGISEENLSKIFEPYYTSKENGMGLGLGATLNILQSHKCLVDVQSKPGAGTIFQLKFRRTIR